MFYVPLQVSLGDEARLDEELLAALGQAMNAGVAPVDCCAQRCRLSYSPIPTTTS